MIKENRCEYYCRESLQRFTQAVLPYCLIQPSENTLSPTVRCTPVLYNGSDSNTTAFRRRPPLTLKIKSCPGPNSESILSGARSDYGHSADEFLLFFFKASFTLFFEQTSHFGQSSKCLTSRLLRLKKFLVVRCPSK